MLQTCFKHFRGCILNWTFEDDYATVSCAYCTFLSLQVIVKFSFISLLFYKTWCGSDVWPDHISSLGCCSPPLPFTLRTAEGLMLGRVYLALEALFWNCGIISLAVQWVTALVMSLYRFTYFSYGIMAEKAAASVGCRSEVWLIEAVGLVCWEVDASMMAQTECLFGTVPVEMLEEAGGGRRHILHLMLVCHLSDFR